MATPNYRKFLSNFPLDPHQLPKDILGKYDGRTLILAGSGRELFSDLARILDPLAHDYMAVNDAIMHLPYPLTHAYSNDSYMLDRWINARRPEFTDDLDLKRPITSHSCNKGVRIDYVWPWPGHGTSGLNAVFTGLALGYKSIILCGIPIDSSGHYFDPPHIKTNYDFSRNLRIWKDAATKYFDGRVRSFSGNTKVILGEPDDAN